MKTWQTKSGYKVIKVLSGRSNVFLVTIGEKNILVDTSPGSLWKILDRRLKKMHISRIHYLVITHTHYDHAENASKLKNRYSARVIVHRNEADYLAAGGYWMVEGTNAFARFMIKTLRKLTSGKMSYDPCKADLVIDERFDLNDLGFNAYILHTPGHTPGSVSLIVEDEIALVGDCMFGVFRDSAFPPFALDSRQMLESWRKLLDTGCRLFLPSHGREDSRNLVQRDYTRRKKIFG